MMLPKLILFTLAAVSGFRGASSLPKKVIEDVQEVAAVRMPAVFTTATTVVITTSTLTVTVGTTCAKLVGVTGDCRRRRGISENPIIIPSPEEIEPIHERMDEALNPSPVETVEKTVAATLDSVRGADAVESVLEASKLRVVDVDIIGLPANCFVAPRNALDMGFLATLSSALASITNVGSGLIINFTSSQTATFTSTVTVTSGTKAFTVSGCTPPGFLYRTC